MNVEDRLTHYFAEQTVDSLQAAYLFGSFAEGRNHAESDVDVGVLFARAELPERLDRQLAAEVLGNGPLAWEEQRNAWGFSRNSGLSA